MVIDYVYHNFGNAGSPLLYIRGRDDASCKTAEDISGDGLPFIPLLDGAFCDVISGDEVYEQLHSDGTAEGFFEVLLFRIMARNFCSGMPITMMYRLSATGRASGLF
jgi:hypothetical protein